jgi:hypothetical protein
MMDIKKSAKAGQMVGLTTTCISLLSARRLNESHFSPQPRSKQRISSEPADTSRNSRR